MKAPATHVTGYEKIEGQLELRRDQLRFNRRKDGRSGSFAAFGLLGLLLSSKYEQYISIPRGDIVGVEPSASNPEELAVTTSRGTMVFLVADREPWLRGLAAAPA
jgi:hypothetical protein